MLLFLASGAALGALLGRSWPLLALSWRLFRAWPSRGAPGSHFRHPGASVGSFSDLFFRRRWKNTKTLIFDDSCSENQGFGVPGGSKIERKWVQNRSRARFGSSWRSSVASWRFFRALGAPNGVNLRLLTAFCPPTSDLSLRMGPNLLSKLIFHRFCVRKSSQNTSKMTSE